MCWQQTSSLRPPRARRASRARVPATGGSPRQGLLARAFSLLFGIRPLRPAPALNLTPPNSRRQIVSNPEFELANGGHASLIDRNASRAIGDGHDAVSEMIQNVRAAT